MKTNTTKHDAKRICPKCNGEKFLNEFYNNKLSYDGRSYHCKDCMKKASKRQYAKLKTTQAQTKVQDLI